MFQSSRKTMKWATLLKDIKEKVGLAPSPPPPSPPAVSTSPPDAPGATAWSPLPVLESSQGVERWPVPAERDKHEMELDFKRFWEDFRSSSSEKDKEMSLNLAVDIFCRLLKRQADVALLVTTLVEAHIFSFVIGRAFVTDIEKLRIYNKTKSLHVGKVLSFFAEVTKDGICPGSNLLYAVEVLVSAPIDKQPLLDSGILCCLIHILNALLNPEEGDQQHFPPATFEDTNNVFDKDALQIRRFEVEGSVVHIMKALASHPSAALSLIEDDSLQLLFQMVANGSLTVFSRFRNGLVTLHAIQLHRHAMQILGLLLVNDNGGTVKYIRKHQLIKVLLIAVKDFNPEDGDSAYTMGIVDLLLECVELSHRPDAGSLRLREDIHNAHGYQFLIQFALTLSSLQKKEVHSQPNSSNGGDIILGANDAPTDDSFVENGDHSPAPLSPSLSRLLDVLVNLAQTGNVEPTGSTGRRGMKSNIAKPSGHSCSVVYSDKSNEDIWENGSSMIRDLEAIQMLQDIFLKSDCVELQAEVLNRIFKIFSSHPDNYMLCQQLKTVPLFILNMGCFPLSLQETILKILEYAVTVVNCVPEQELLSLCCLLQQPTTSNLKLTVLSFFVKLISFDYQYKKVLREVGVLGVLIDDLKQHKFVSVIDHPTNNCAGGNKFTSDNPKQSIDTKDVLLSSPRLLDSSGRFSVFEDEATIAVAWDCLVSLLKKAEANQSSFRSANGFSASLPFLVYDIHRPGILRMISCLMIEDIKQVHSEELGAVIEILKSGMVTSNLGLQFRFPSDAKCDLLGMLWRILVANTSAQRVFGEATGFSLLLTALHGFQCDNELVDIPAPLEIHMKVFFYLLRVMTAAVYNNAVNRLRLHDVIISQTFYDLLVESNLLCVDWENQTIQLLLELALEIVVPPSTSLLPGNAMSSETEPLTTNFFSSSSSGTFIPEKERVYNGGAVAVLIRSLLLFTPKLQLELLVFIEKLASAGPFNQESLTSIGCIGLLLDMIRPFLTGSSSLLIYTLRIVQVLGAYRLSTPELRTLVRYILQFKSVNSGYYLVEMLEKLIQVQDTRSEIVSPAPFVEMDLSRMGHASVHVSLGERTWPPAAGYSFVCWFQYHISKFPAKEQNQLPKVGFAKSNSNVLLPGGRILQFFSVGSVDDGNSFYAELYLEDNGNLTLATSNSCSLSFSGLELEDGKWHHLAIVHSKPNALAGLFQASVANVYLNGKLRHTGKLGYSPSPVGKSLQVTIGTPVTRAKVSELSWRFRCCYLFEEVLTSGGICFMYILGKGYRGIFQDADLLQFVPNHACGGASMAILDSLDTDPSAVSNIQRNDNAVRQGNLKVEGSGIVWDLERLGNLSLQVIGKKLIFAFDGTSSEALKATGALSMLNLVDPMSAAASPIGGIPRFGRLNGDSYICHQCVIGDSIRAVGGMTVILFLVEAAETKDMLHASLSLLACALEQNPQNVLDMQACRGYHLLAIFLRRKMPLFEMQSLEIFFQIAACEASFVEPQKLLGDKIMSPVKSPEASFEELSLPKLSDEISSVGSQGDLDDFCLQKDVISHLSELENTDLPTETANCVVLSNADMVEHVLLDWTLWVTAPISIQLALLGFLERMVSMHWYRNHNLTLLRRINLVQHLLVTLQRGDVEVQVLEKLVVLLGVILEDGFLVSELEVVVRFVIMTFDPPELRSRQQIVRETMGKHVIVRNMLLEMLIDLQVTIPFEEQIEQWHKIVSSKLITCFLDEAVHPTSMRWIMTLLGVCLTSSSTFALKFRTSGGYHILARVLPFFYDSPEIYYTIFCLIFGKNVYPRVPEVRMGDFHALMSSDGYYGELKFIELLDSVIAMSKSTFDRLSMQTMLLHKNDHSLQFNVGLVAELVESTSDVGGDLQVEALKHKTSARLMGGDATAPATATAILRFMVDLAKMCPSFSAICRRKEFLDTCVDLYFSCVRADRAVKMAKNLASGVSEEKSLRDMDDNQSTLYTISSLPQEHEQSSKTTTSIRSFPQGHTSASSEDISCVHVTLPRLKENTLVLHNFDAESVDQMSVVTSSTCDISYVDTKLDPDRVPAGVDSPVSSEKSNSKSVFTPSSSPAIASWFGGTGSQSEIKPQLTSMPSTRSSASDVDTSFEQKTSLQGSSAANSFFPINPRLLVEIDDAGYGGGPCSAGATAVLDFVAVVLADIIAEQIKGSQFTEGILEAVPLYVDVDTTLIFQGLCMSRLTNFLERRLLRDDEEDEKKLDKTRWSLNLDALSWMIVDRIYMGAFSRPVDVLRTLEFLLSMLQLANKDGRIEEILPSGKSILSITKGAKQLEPYILSLLKNANRMIMYCFLPSFLSVICEDYFLSCLGFQTENKKGLPLHKFEDEHNIDICTILQLVIANKRLVFCPSNVDSDLICCLCVNLFSLLRDQRQSARNLAVDIIKYMLQHRRSALEELLVPKQNQGSNINILHGGFDKLLSGSSAEFFEWLGNSELIINNVLEQNPSLMWVQYISGPAKLPGARIKTMEVRRKNEMGKKARDASKLDLRHWEQITERRYALEVVRDAMSTELRVIRQDKYGWVLHAESEWEAHLQHLVHDRGIFPINYSTAEPEWQLCSIEGPYRMRKKLEHCRFKTETIHNVLIGALELEEKHLTEDREENGFLISESGSERFFNLPSDGGNDIENEGDHEFGDSFFKGTQEYRGVESMSAEIGWNDDHVSSINELSLHSVPDIGVKSSSSVHITDSINAKSELGSPRLSSSMKVDDATATDDKSEKELNDNGEYLIRPYLEPSEKIRFRYNCERVVGLDKHDGIFLIGELSLYIIENFFIDDTGCICEKQNEDDLSVIDQALGVKKDVIGSSEFQMKSPSTWGATMKAFVGGRAWAYNGGAWGKEKACSSGNLPHPWHMWKLDCVHELLKRDYQLRPVAVEIFSMDGCNDLLVFHKKEREEVFKNLVSLNLPRNNMLDATISGLSKQESSEGSRLFKTMAKSFSKRWQAGEISNFQYLMHLNTLAGRGYRDLTQYPVFPWVLADYEGEILDLRNPKCFRKLDKPMGCQTADGEEEFKKRYESWDDPDVPKFHYGSHYSSAGIVLFYLLRLPPFSIENQKLQGGQFDHADRLFNSVRDTWQSAAGKGNTSDVKELIPEFFYFPEFLENKFNLDLGEKQSGEKVGDVMLPPWAKGSAREFIKKHREALESDYVSENLHNWIDLIFGYKQRGKAAEEAVNVFYHYTYEGNVDIDSVSDPAMKASILAQINHFGQTPKQLFLKPHVKRRVDRKVSPHPLRLCSYLVSRDVRKLSSSISQIVSFHDKILVSGSNNLLKPVTYNKYIAWGFPDRSLRFLSYDQDRLLSTHESLHGGNQIQCAGIAQDGHILVTGADDGVVSVWRISKDGVNSLRRLRLESSLCAHTAKITCLYVSQPYSLIVTGSDDCSAILWDLSSLVFVKQLPQFPAPVTAVHVNDLTGEIVTAAGILLAVWSVNGDCLAVVNTSQLPSDSILSVTTATYSDWQDTNWYVTGHQSGAVKIWNMLHCSTDEESSRSKLATNATANFGTGGRTPEYRLVLRKVLKSHKNPVSALLLTPDRKQLLSGDSEGHLVSWTLPDESLRASINQG